MEERMSRNKYYLIKKDLRGFTGGDWQLKKGNIIEDVGSNMFIAESISASITNRFQQLNMFEKDLLKVLIKHNITDKIEEV